MYENIQRKYLKNYKKTKGRKLVPIRGQPGCENTNTYYEVDEIPGINENFELIEIAHKNGKLIYWSNPKPWEKVDQSLITKHQISNLFFTILIVVIIFFMIICLFKSKN